MVQRKLTRRLYIPLLTALLAVSLQNCTTIQCGTTKSQFLENYFNFIEEATGEEYSVTDKRWGVYDDRLETYILDCYPSFRDDLTVSDRQEILTHALGYYYVRYGSHMIKELQNEDNRVSQALMDEMGELWSNPNELLREVMGDDWDELLNEFLEDLDKWQNKFRDLLQDYDNDR